MKLFIKILIVFLYTFNSSAKSSLTIQGNFEEFEDNTFVVLSQYNYEDVIVYKTSIKSGKCLFNNLPQLQEGVYQIIVNHPVDNNNKQSAYFFNIIIDKSESDIQFYFNPNVNPIPSFTKSEINKNWYIFLEFQNFRLEAIAVKNGNDSNSFNLKRKEDDILKNEIDELKQIRSNYLKVNYNKWSGNMVKNTPFFSKLEGIKKENYWNQFETNNPELINTPICQEYIRNYIINYYNHADKEQYKTAFQEVIDVFSKNESTKEWIIKYVITGFYRIENNKLSSFFSKKYNYKI